MTVGGDPVVKMILGLSVCRKNIFAFILDSRQIGVIIDFDNR